MFSGPLLPDGRFQLLQVEVALEVVGGRRIQHLFGHHIDRLAACQIDVGAGGVKVPVVQHILSLFDEKGEQHLLGSPALMGSE